MDTGIDRDTRKLSDLLIREITKALALPQQPWMLRGMRALFGRAAVRFAELAARLDRVVAEEGVAAGARWVLPRFVRAHATRGEEHIPPDGPLVIAANHPGAYDSLVISAHVTRPDYKVIIGDIPFFQNLPGLSRYALFAPAAMNLSGRVQVVRQAIRHLHDGGSLLIFARGGIEPDPACMPAPDAEFDLWSRSLQIFLERVPQTKVLVTMVSGVIARAAMKHPITWFRRARPDRQRLAFMLQMIQQVRSGREKFGLTPRVSFGDCIGLEQAGSAERALECIRASAHRLIQSHIACQP